MSVQSQYNFRIEKKEKLSAIQWSIMFVLLSILLFAAAQANAQITFLGCTNNVDKGSSYSLGLNGNVINGSITRNTYTSSGNPSCPAGICNLKIIWNNSSSRWEIQLINGFGNFVGLLFSNNSASYPDPPSLSLGTWVAYNGCTGISTLSGSVQNSISTGPSCTMTTSISSSNVSCNGQSDGSATATVSNGSPNYNYSWSNGTNNSAVSSNSNTINGLSIGSYSVTVTDSNGCTSTSSSIVTEPPILLGGSISAN